MRWFRQLLEKVLSCSRGIHCKEDQSGAKMSGVGAIHTLCGPGLMFIAMTPQESLILVSSAGFPVFSYS